MLYGWAWIALIVVAIIVEVLSDQLISIWFVPGAIVATILDFFNVDLIWQILAVLILAAGGIIFAKTFLTKRFRTNIVKTNIEAIIGERCVVTEKIDNYVGCGQVKIKGQIWSARGVDEDDVFEEGDVLRVVAIEGVKVICKK
jgi:membrane protein implicated in regulation of membrane protease activity